MKLSLNMKFTQRDIMILGGLLMAAILFAYWQLLLTPLRDKISGTQTQIAEKETQLAIEEANIARLPEVKAQQDEAEKNIRKIAAKYLPNRSNEFYYDIIIKKLRETQDVTRSGDAELADITLLPEKIDTAPLSSTTVNDGPKMDVPENSLTDAIGEYNTAVNPSEETTSTTTPAKGTVYSFNYIPFTYKIAGGNFKSAQNFFDAMNALNYTMYFPSVSISAETERTVGFECQMYFISIDRLFDEADPEKYETIDPADRDEVFLYPVEE